MNSTINRGQFLRMMGAGAASLALPRSAGAQGGQNRPNIIFIFTDDHASHAISAYGSKINQTPNCDRIANEGMLFRNCFCTNSICAPSRAVILTGKHSHLNGVPTNRETFDGSQQTFPKLLQGAGYQTAMIGKWHLKSEPTGFDFWNVLIGQGPYYNPTMRTPDGNVDHTGYTTDIVTDIALDWLKTGRDPDKPFMMMYQHKAPHRNWQPGPDHLTMYDGETIPEPDNLFDDYEGRTSAAKFQEMTVAENLSENDLKLNQPGGFTDEQLEAWNEAYGPKNQAFENAGLEGDELTRWKYQRYIKDYLRCVASVDDNVGRLLDYLDETGLAENTVVVYSSDQGFYLGDHGWFDKRWMYEESFRMPLMVRWPGVAKAGSVNTDLVQNLDFAETFLNIAGAEAPSDMQGESLVPLLRGQTPADWRESVYYHYYEFPSWHTVRRHEGVRTDRYKLIHYYNIDEWELFDLQSDPGEMRSVYGDPGYATVRNRLRAELETLKAQYKVTDIDVGEAPPDPEEVRLETVLRYDFGNTDGPRLMDGSKHGHHAALTGVEAVDGLRGKAGRFGNGASAAIDPVPRSLDLTFRPFTVGAWCKPASKNGAVFAIGNPRYGVGLYLENGKPALTLRGDSYPYTAAAKSAIPLNEWTHLAGILDTQGIIHLYVNGKRVAVSEKPHFVGMFNGGSVNIGSDAKQPLTGLANPQYKGDIEDLRLYLGVLDSAALGEWSSK